MTYIPGPIAERIIALDDLLDVAERNLDATAYADVMDGLEARRCAAVAELDASDEPREFTLTEDGYEFARVIAANMSEACALAKQEVDPSCYDTSHGTVWTGIHVEDALTSEHEYTTVQIDQAEPPCAASHEHDWQSPYEVLGGLRENPGVYGHGGGVIIREVCAHCGRYRITDTWAQRTDTGEQGLHAVTYKDADDASLSWANLA